MLFLCYYRNIRSLWIKVLQNGIIVDERNVKHKML